MKREVNVDQVLDSWFTEGPTNLPDRTVAAIVDRLDENQRSLTWLPGRGRMNRRTLALGGVAAALIALIGAGSVFDWNLHNLVGGRPTPSVSPNPTLAPTSDEAVFVRRDASDLLVIGVDKHGHERIIARLAESWTATGRPFPAPAGALSPSGLLVMAVGTDEFHVRWTVFDLLHPDSTPRAVTGIANQDVDQLDYSYFNNEGSSEGRASWGPGDRLVIAWYERIPEGGDAFSRNYFVTFDGGPTAEATSVDIDDELVVLPYWVRDGSGVLVQQSAGRHVLHADGTLTEELGTVPEASCTKLLPLVGPPADPADYEEAPCVSPDGFLLVDTSSVDAIVPTARLVVQATGESFVVAGQFVGWLPLSAR